MPRHTLKKSTMASYKVRKSGNSDIITLPSSVQEALDVTAGDSIKYIINGNRVEIIKDIPEVDVETAISDTIEQYNELLSKLVDL